MNVKIKIRIIIKIKNQKLKIENRRQKNQLNGQLKTGLKKKILLPLFWNLNNTED